METQRHCDEHCKDRRVRADVLPEGRRERRFIHPQTVDHHLELLGHCVDRLFERRVFSMKLVHLALHLTDLFLLSVTRGLG